MQLRQATEDARVTHSLAELRAEDVMQRARVQARRLLATAGAVAKARREQAEREASAVIAAAERAAASTVATAEEQAADPGSAPDSTELYGRLLSLQTSLRDAETRLEAFAGATRRDVEAVDIVDLEALSEEPEQVVAPGSAALVGPQARWTHPAVPGSQPVAAEHEEPEGTSKPQDLSRPRNRFDLDGTAPDRIESLRDELAL